MTLTNKQNNFGKNILCWHLEGCWGKEQDAHPLSSVQIQGSVSVSKCHGSGTLVLCEYVLCKFLNIKVDCSPRRWVCKNVPSQPFLPTFIHPWQQKSILYTVNKIWKNHTMCEIWFRMSRPDVELPALWNPDRKRCSTPLPLFKSLFDIIVSRDENTF
jgi:hypothetical protein